MRNFLCLFYQCSCKHYLSDFKKKSQSLAKILSKFFKPNNVMITVFGMWSAVNGYTVSCFLWVSAKLGTCTVVNVNGTQVEDKMCRFMGGYAPFRFNRCPIYTHDGASAKFSTNSQETDNSVFADSHKLTRFALQAVSQGLHGWVLWPKLWVKRISLSTITFAFRTISVSVSPLIFLQR